MLYQLSYLPGVIWGCDILSAPDGGVNGAKLLPSQSAALAARVAAAVRCERPDLAAIGRRMAGPTTAKSAIKRAWRFTCDRRVEVAGAMAGVIERVARRCKKPLIISFDWADVRDLHTR